MMRCWRGWRKITRARIFCARSSCSGKLVWRCSRRSCRSRLDDARRLLRVAGSVARGRLVENVAPIQLAIRLLIPAGSRLLELEEIRRGVGDFDEAALVYPWKHADPRVDRLCERIQGIVHAGEQMKRSRAQIFERIEDAAFAVAGGGITRSALPVLASRAAVPYLNEPWYC